MSSQPQRSMESLKPIFSLNREVCLGTPFRFPVSLDWQNNFFCAPAKPFLTYWRYEALR
jgi:hypothetical protein